MIDTSSRALVVDDFVTMTMVMKTLVQRIGFEEVDVCHDGATALSMLKLREYGFVLCDVGMEPVSGVEFAQRARSHSSGRDCIILLTTVSPHGAEEVARSGVGIADGIILKPFNAAALKAKLEEIADRRLCR